MKVVAASEQNKGRGCTIAVEVVATATVTIVAVAVAARLGGAAGEWRWLVVPALWAAGAMVPTLTSHRTWEQVGLRQARVKADLLPTVLGAAGIAVTLLIAALLARAAGLALPLQPHVAGPWALWVVYQFLYVAPAEELFFRGYAQERFQALLAGHLGSETARQAGAVVMSSALFAVAHVAVTGGPAQAWVFLPALLFGAARVWTGAIWAPIALHAWANVAYGLLAASPLGRA